MPDKSRFEKSAENSLSALFLSTSDSVCESATEFAYRVVSDSIGKLGHIA